MRLIVKADPQGKVCFYTTVIHSKRQLSRSSYFGGWQNDCTEVVTRFAEDSGIAGLRSLGNGNDWRFRHCGSLASQRESWLGLACEITNSTSVAQMHFIAYDDGVFVDDIKRL